MQQRKHSLIFPGLIEDGLDEFRRIEFKSDFLRRLDDGLLQISTLHLAEQDLTAWQQRFNLLMSYKGIIEIGTHRADDDDGRGVRRGE